MGDLTLKMLTNQEIKEMHSVDLGLESSRCPTKSQIVAGGLEVVTTSINYSDSQLVKRTDVKDSLKLILKGSPSSTAGIYEYEIQVKGTIGSNSIDKTFAGSWNYPVKLGDKVSLRLTAYYRKTAGGALSLAVANPSGINIASITKSMYYTIQVTV